LEKKRLLTLLNGLAQQNYFVFHAPRQTGKTTAMLTLAKKLTDEGPVADRPPPTTAKFPRRVKS
jgi:predicted AAA+ superfamily ATPase